MNYQVYQYPLSHTGPQQIPKIGVLHAMGEFISYNGRIYSAKEWLDFLGLAAHYTITPSGVICEHLDINIMGAHAKGYNKGTVGIEFLLGGVWTNEPFKARIQSPYLTDEQYTAGLLLCRDLHQKGIIFKTHSEIDNRYENGKKVKVDPGTGFPFEKLMNEINC